MVTLSVTACYPSITRRPARLARRVLWIGGRRGPVAPRGEEWNTVDMRDDTRRDIGCDARSGAGCTPAPDVGCDTGSADRDACPVVGWADVGRLVRQTTLDAVALHFAAIASAGGDRDVVVPHVSRAARAEAVRRERFGVDRP